MTRNL